MPESKMRPIRETIQLDEALAIIEASAVPITRTARVPLGDSDGRVLALDVIATADVPPFDRAAMDGFAVVAGDTFGAGTQTPCTLRCVETVHTGEIPTTRLDHGSCTEIATGAPMPEGADAVVMVEQTDRGPNGDVRIFTPVYPWQHVGRRAADIATGRVTLQRGDLLTPSRLGAIAALGIGEVDVFDRPRVATLSTGNEIIEPGQPLGPGQIYDINRFTLGAVSQRARWRRGELSDRGRHARLTRGSCRRVSRQRRPRLLRWELGRRAGPDARRAPQEGHGDVPRDSRQARKTNGVRTDR